MFHRHSRQTRKGPPAALARGAADAGPVIGYAELLTTAGLTVSHTERHDAAMTRVIDQTKPGSACSG